MGPDESALMLLPAPSGTFSGHFARFSEGYSANVFGSISATSRSVMSTLDLATGFIASSDRHSAWFDNQMFAG